MENNEENQIYLQTGSSEEKYEEPQLLSEIEINTNPIYLNNTSNIQDSSNSSSKIIKSSSHNISKLLDKVENDREERKRLEEIVSYLKVQKQPFQESDLNLIFDRLDIDGDNVITTEEVKRFLNSLRSPVNDFYIEKLLKDFDPNKSGNIQREEFMTKMKSHNNKGKSSDLTELLEIFKLFDANHDDQVCEQDLQNMLKALGENFDQNTCKEMMKFLGDQNGKISFSKFFELVKDED